MALATARARQPVDGGQLEAEDVSWMPPSHEPVLTDELIELLRPRPGDRVVDCTFGDGGHARRLAEAIGAQGELIAIDRDPEAIRRFERFETEAEPRARFVRADFADVLESIAAGAQSVDAVVMDLGVSSMQLDTRERGFSYAYDAPLDMRMDPQQRLSAGEVVNEWPQDRLARALKELGEERHAGAIAREVARRRPIATSGELVEAVRAAVPPAYRFGRGHPAKRTFQAIRIAVNAELESLDRALPAAWSALALGGRLAVISFHSLEDRRAKRFLAERARACICPPELPECRCGGTPEAELLTRRVVRPSAGELAANPRAASARLRVARKLTPTRDRGAGG